MKKLFCLLLLLPSSLLIAQKVEYLHMGKTYPVDGAARGDAFYLEGERRVPLPHGGEYRIIEEEKAFDPKEFYLPPFYSLEIKNVLPLNFSGPQAKQLVLNDRQFSPYTDPRILNMEGAWTVDELRGGVLLVIWIKDGKIKYIADQGWLDTGNRITRLRFHVNMPVELRGGYPVLAVVKNSDLLPVSKPDYLPISLKAAAIGDVDSIRDLDERALRHKDAFGSTALHKAALYGQGSTVAHLLAAGLSPDDKNDFGQTPLILAAMAGRAEVISAMLAADERSVSLEDKTGSNALHYAVISGDIDLVDTLLQSKRGQGLVDAVNDSGYTPLEVTILDAADEDYQLLKGLSDERELRTVLKASASFLRAASARGADSIVHDLLEAGAHTTDEVMIATVTAGTRAVAEHLLEHGADVNSNTYGADGLTPLMSAAHEGRLEAVTFLIEKGADIDAKTKRGATALWLAVARNREEVVKALLENGADISIEDLPLPLELALYVENQGIIGELVNAGAACDINLENVDKLLERALRNDVASVVSSALGVCIDPDYKIAGIYPLEWAAQYYEATSVLDVLPPDAEGAAQIEFASMKQLDDQLKAVSVTNPAYPEDLIDKYGDIRAKARIIVAADGSVRFPKMIDNPAPEMTQHIIEALSRWKFEPPRKDGESTQVQCIVPVVVNAPAKDRAVWQLIDLDTPPRAVKQVRPRYPTEARRGGRTGTVVVQFVVDEQGNVLEPRVTQSLRFFGQAALEAVSQWRFQPGMRDGRPVKVIVNQPVVFSLQ